MMPKSRFLLPIFSLVFAVFFLPYLKQPSVLADSPTPTPDTLLNLENQLQQNKSQLDQLNQQKNAAQNQLDQANQKVSQTQRSLNSISQTLQDAKNQLAQTLLDLDQKQKQIDATLNFINIKEDELNHQRGLLNSQVRNFYMNSFSDPAAIFLAGSDFSQSSQLVIFRQAIITGLKGQIEGITAKIKDLSDQKAALDKQKNSLEGERIVMEQKKADLETQIVSTQKDLVVAQSQQQNLIQSLAGFEAQISSLTQQQQQILAAKAAAALSTTTVGDIEQIAPDMPSPPADGQLYFSFWTYGYPHRVGMNQYGAYGRAKAGQNAEEILKAYYSGVSLGTYPEMSSITINDNSGTRSILFEDDYLMGIGEMPSCWGDPQHGGLEALKAQAVAARTYAIAATANGQASICTDQRCQVYTGSAKVNGQCGQYWKQAVDSTRGLVVLSQGQPIQAWYASTAGGFTLSSKDVWGEDRSYAQGISDFSNASDLQTAYDGPKFGDSPWYHKSWGDKPWLSLSEVQDIFNAALLPDNYNDQLSSADKGGFTSDQVVAALKDNNVTPVSSLKSIEVLGSATKASSKVRAYFGDTYQEVDANRFRFVFNLRSQGTDAIWTSRFDFVSSK